MRPKSDDVADASHASPAEPPDRAAYRQVRDALRQLNPDERDVERRMKDISVPELGNRTLEDAHARRTRTRRRSHVSSTGGAPYD